MILPRILSVGKDKTLMASRTLLMSNSGYAVEEAYSLEKAIGFVEADSIDATVICHTVPNVTKAYSFLLCVKRDA
jgi:DNA-binding response OmpR family regulator